MPLSLGVSSLVLLHVLDSHLKRQMRRTGRTGFRLQILHIQLPDQNDQDARARFAAIQQRYPDYPYNFVPLLDASPAQSSTAQEHSATAASNSESQIARLLSALPSTTSRVDILHILRLREIVQHTISRSCEGILFGSSTTSLAERILAETSKGRGFSLPWQVLDGPSPWGTSFYYPARDLLKKELIAFAEMNDPSLTGLMLEEQERRAPAASRDGSIDVLMKGYFESVEEQYPSIVANVVRTVGKLEVGKQEGAEPCRLCKMRFKEENEGGLADGLCYGCARAVPQDCLQWLPKD